jgi:DNA-binding MarR family transcriptional regulator
VANTDGLEELLNEVRLLYHRAIEVGDDLHRDEPVTMSMRAVLEFLHHNAPATVPAIARARHVTRQHIQALVNELLAEELVELVENPAHERSKKACLTTRGTKLFTRMKKREAKVFRTAVANVSVSTLRSATTTLKALRAALGNS